ncbi:MAG: tripartite tricarboxylate transporter substrate binding protein [Betaproteobacteria bacterium]
MTTATRAATLLFAASLPLFAQAQTWPAKTVRVVTPWPAGGLTDIAGRIVFQKISENLGQQFVVDNRGGATGTIGAEIVARAPADGYTLMVNSMTHLGNPYIYKKLPYDTIGDFAPVGIMVAQTGLLVVHPSLPVKTVKELVALARTKPGEILYSSTGSGGFADLSVVLLTSMTNTKMTQVNYKGGGPAAGALLAGETQVLVSSPAAATQQLAAKRIRLLAVTSDTRLTAFPDAPTIAEAGVPGYEYRGWVGVFAPTGTPKPIIDKLNTEIKKAIDSPELKKRLEEFEPWTMSPQAMAARIQSDYEKYGRLMKLVGSKLD